MDRLLCVGHIWLITGYLEIMTWTEHRSYVVETHDNISITLDSDFYCEKLSS